MSVLGWVSSPARRVDVPVARAHDLVRTGAGVRDCHASYLNYSPYRRPEPVHKWIADGADPDFHSWVLSTNGLLAVAPD